MTTATIHTTKKAHDGPCYWCRREAALRLYGTVHEHQTYWSPPLCSIACHNEMYDG